ncbi:MAG: metallophosphoesterase [Anaerolineales bacterium]|nr:metallophosphoesterase [Anaerolineales bacterium]
MKKIIPLILVLAFLFSNPYPSAHAQTDKITFAVIGDYGLASQSTADVANLVKSWNPDFIVTVGDNNYPNGTAETIDNNIGQYYSDFIHPYKGKYGSGATTPRFFPALGNHDWGSAGTKPFTDYFGFHREKRYYDFVWGSVHFFILDSDRNEPDGYTASSDQAKWLRKSLTASTSAFQVVVMHHAPYSSGRHGSNLYMQWQFKQWGADVILSGHDHVYERLLVEGIPYFVNGVGGAELYKFETKLPESQSRYNLDFGAMRVEASNTYMKFQFITRTGVLIDEYIIGQSYANVSSVTRLNSSPTNSSNVNFQVTFSESVTGVDVSDFILSTNIPNAVIDNITGSGNIYTVSVSSANVDGTLRLDLVDDDSVTSGSLQPLGGVGLGNGNFSNGEVYTIDKTPPKTIAITRVNSNPTSLASVNFQVTFSEPLTGVDVSDFAVITNNNAQLINVTGSGNLYTVTVNTNIGNDEIRLDFINNGSVFDLANNPANENFTNGETYSIDRTAPIVTSITRANVNGLGVDFTVRFSEAVTGVDGSDFFLSTINNATITNIIGANDLYTVSVLLNPGTDVIRLDLINNNSINDVFGNLLGGNFTNGEVYSTSFGVPVVASIVRASNNPTNANSVDFIVTFTELVNGVDINDFVLNNGAYVTNINNANPFYVVTVNTGANEGLLKLDLIDDDSIINPQNIPLGGEGIGNANFTNGDSFTIDRTPPQVTSIIRASNNPTIDSSVNYIVTFSEPVMNVDTADFFVTTSNLNSFATNIQNQNPFYIINVSTGAGSGNLRLDLLNNNSITDLAGNMLISHFTNGESFTVAKPSVNFDAPNLFTNRIPVLSNNPQPNISWSNVKNAQAYEIFIARDSNFSQIVLIQTIAKTDFTIPNPLNDGMYYVKVRAYNKDLYPGKFSKPYSFTIDTTPPTAPILVSPAQASASPQRPTLQWSGDMSGIEYQIQVDNNADFSSPEFNANTKNKSIRTSTLSKNINYYWRVRVKDKAGNWSEWSKVFYFYVR